MRSSILYFVTALGLVLSAPIDDVTDISATENNGSPLCDPTQGAGCASTPQISSTYPPPSGVESVESHDAVTGFGGSDISTQTSESPDLDVAFKPDTTSDTQFSGIDNSVPLVIASEQDSSGSSGYVPPASHQVWNCDDFSTLDKGGCTMCMHERCQLAWQVTCVPGSQDCTACQLTNGMCGSMFKATRQSIGHMPSSYNPYGQDWCANSGCARKAQSPVEKPKNAHADNRVQIPGNNPVQNSGVTPCLYSFHGTCILTWWLPTYSTTALIWRHGWTRTINSIFWSSFRHPNTSLWWLSSTANFFIYFAYHFLFEQRQRCYDGDLLRGEFFFQKSLTCSNLFVLQYPP